ncbi:MAG: VOC family protein [Pseudomonadota bacterium]
MNDRINYVELPARDLKAVEAFYARAFGWTFTWYGDGYLAFNDGAFDGGFFKADLCSQTRHGAALVVLRSEQLEASKEAVIAAGGTVVQDIFDFPGGRRFHFEDPAGNELAIWGDAPDRSRVTPSITFRKRRLMMP